jgi:hypothetical protein
LDRASTIYPLTAALGGVLRSIRLLFAQPGVIPLEFRADSACNEVVDFLSASDGREYAVTLDGLVRRRGDRWEPAKIGSTEYRVRWSGASLAESPRHGLMCSTGIELFQENHDIWSPVIEGASGEHGICVTADGAVVSTTRVLSGGRAFVEFMTNTWVQVSAEFEAPHDYVEDLREAPDGSVWAVGFDTLIRWRRQGTAWREFAGVPPPAFVDGAGRIWFAEGRNPYAGQRGRELWFGCNGATGGTNGLVKQEAGRQTFHPVETLFNMTLAPDGTLLAGGPAKFVLVPNEPDAEPITISVPRSELGQAIIDALARPKT